MPKISAVGLFYWDKFEETQNEKGFNLSKLTKPNFDIFFEKAHSISNAYYLVDPTLVKAAVVV